MSPPLTYLRKLFEMKIFLIVNLVVLGLLVLSFGREAWRNATIEQQIATLKQQKDALSTRNSELLSFGQTIQTQFFIEKEGRLKYDLRKPGEQLVVVTDQKTATPSDTGATNTASETPNAPESQAAAASPSAGNPSRWWSYLFNPAAYQALRQSYGS